MIVSSPPCHRARPSCSTNPPHPLRDPAVHAPEGSDTLALRSSPLLIFLLPLHTVPTSVWFRYTPSFPNRFAQKQTKHTPYLELLVCTAYHACAFRTLGTAVKRAPAGRPWWVPGSNSNSSS
eukprot:Sspe_Gene.48587::Locus_25435_Transcript_1_1_Confidence_1.000_Length_488::g.48587::m.48587